MLSKLLLAILLEDNVLVRLNDVETLSEHLLAVLLAHEGLELGEVAARDVDHLLLACIARDGRVLALVLNLATLGPLCALLHP